MMLSDAHQLLLTTLSTSRFNRPPSVVIQIFDVASLNPMCGPYSSPHTGRGWGPATACRADLSVSVSTLVVGRVFRLCAASARSSSTLPDELFKRRGGTINRASGAAKRNTDQLALSDRLKPVGSCPPTLIRSEHSATPNY